MGMGVIVSGGKDGRYRVRIQLEQIRLELERAQIDTDIADMTAALASAEEALTYAEMEVNEAAFALNALIQHGIDLAADGEDPDPPIDPDDDDDSGAADVSGLIAAHNSERTTRSLDSLASITALNAAAQGHADWMARNDTMSHTGEGGSSPQHRANAAGYGGGVSENVAAGQTSVARVMPQWMASPPHRRNILHPPFIHIGIGYRYRKGTKYEHFWCVLFGLPL